jgi:hypothetical protein
VGHGTGVGRVKEAGGQLRSGCEAIFKAPCVTEPNLPFSTRSLNLYSAGICTRLGDVLYRTLFERLAAKLQIWDPSSDPELARMEELNRPLEQLPYIDIEALIPMELQIF